MKFIDTLKRLHHWKKLPSYKAEPRIDFIIAGALPEIIRERYNAEIKDLIPELPLRVGTLDMEKAEDKLNKDRSFKVDFYALLENGRHIFIEFKSDSGSRNDKQDRYLKLSKECGMAAIVEGILRISTVTSYKKKYGHLLQCMEGAGLIMRQGNNYSRAPFENNVIEVLYIQPKAENADEVGFEAVARLMNESGDAVYVEFSKMLTMWTQE